MQFGHELRSRASLCTMTLVTLSGNFLTAPFQVVTGGPIFGDKHLLSICLTTDLGEVPLSIPARAVLFDNSRQFFVVVGSGMRPRFPDVRSSGSIDQA